MKQRQKTKESVYKRFSNKDSNSDEETELFIKSRPKVEIPSIEKYVEEGDTLQSIAIRYQCTIEELKRLNHIHQENEIFARTKIKVPKRLTTLSLARVHSSGKSSPTDDSQPSTSGANLDFNVLNTKISLANKGQDEVNEIIFNSNLVQTPKCDTNTLIDDTNELNEKVQLLPNENVPSAEVVSRFTFDGSGADISVLALVLCIVLVIFAIPLIYVFYIAEHPEKFHHQHVTHHPTNQSS